MHFKRFDWKKAHTEAALHFKMNISQQFSGCIFHLKNSKRFTVQKHLLHLCVHCGAMCCMWKIWLCSFYVGFFHRNQPLGEKSYKHEKNMAVVISRLIFHRNQVLLELQLCWRDFTKHFVGQHLLVEKVHLSNYKS